MGFYPWARSLSIVLRGVSPYGARMQAAWVSDASWAAELARLPAELRDIYFTPAYHHLHSEDAGCVVVSDGNARLIVPGLLHPISEQTGIADLQTCNGYGGPLVAGAADADWLARAWDSWR